MTRKIKAARTLQRETAESSVEILLATYNGERFLREQIDSLLGQDYSRIKITARDDSSSDGTRKILAEYAARFPTRFRVLDDRDRSGGAKWNFLRLMQQSTAHYVCLADQDDVWRPWKVSRQMQAMRTLEQRYGAEMPLLVFTDLEVVDSELRQLDASFWKVQRINPARIFSLSHLLVQNVVTGCASLLNHTLVQLALEMPAESHMHDWWIALMASIYGKAAYLRERTVLYRQHGANVFGIDYTPLPHGVPNWRAHGERKRLWDTSERQAAATLGICAGRLPRQAERLLLAFERCERSRSRFVRSGTFVRHRFFRKGLRSNLATLWYLWDMDRAKRDEAAQRKVEALG